jgi:uncharacterized protein YabE (DUF348 family)
MTNILYTIKTAGQLKVSERTGADGLRPTTYVVVSENKHSVSRLLIKNILGKPL